MSVIIVGIFIFFVGYCIGAIPSGVLIAHRYGIDNLLSRGSGNSGATNVARILGVRFFFIVFLVDCLKAFFCCFLLQSFGFNSLLCITGAVGLLIGNGYSLFLRFKGGKGIATLVGILLAYAPVVSVIFFCSWLFFLLLIRIVGIASVLALVTIIAGTIFVTNDLGLQLFIIGAALWALWRHRENIKRYIGGNPDTYTT